MSIARCPGTRGASRWRHLMIAALLVLAPLNASRAAVPRVVTDFAPIQSLVIQVMGQVGAPEMLMPLGGDPHHFQLRPSQARSLAEAQIVFWDGPELMPDLAKAIATLASHAVSVPLLHKGGGKIRHFPSGAIDPHAWLDPENGKAWLATIAAELGKLDPEHRAIYAANARAAQRRLAKLDAELTKMLKPARGVPIVEFHDAFEYFAAHYHLNVVATIESGDAATPGAARLARIRTLLRDSKAVCVFPELGRDPRFVQTVTAGTGARIGAGQDPEAAALTTPPGPKTYGQILRNLARGVADCVAG